MRTNRGLMCLGFAAVAIVLMGSPMASEAGDRVFVEGSMTLEQPVTSYDRFNCTAELFIDGIYHPVAVTVTILERKMADDGTEVSQWNIEFSLGGWEQGLEVSPGAHAPTGHSKAVAPPAIDLDRLELSNHGQGDRLRSSFESCGVQEG